MNDRGTTADQQTVHHPPSVSAPPAGLSYLLAAATVGGGYGVACIIDHVTPINLGVGAYGLALAVMSSGMVGYFVRSEGARVLRANAAELATARAQRDEVCRELSALRQAVQQLQSRAMGRTYLSTACGRVPAAAPVDGDTVTMSPASAERARRGGRPLDRTEYWGVYTDVLDDLGGLDGKQPPEG